MLLLKYLPIVPLKYYSKYIKMDEHPIVSTNHDSGKYLSYNIICKPPGGFCCISCCLYVIVRIVPCANCALE
ncbi:unnamed protein product [Acanthoscelides obtectus]|uniref:Uncharacterized protein n=1 Tax=Acanthoscelides obtectus TaxID=200917 RepID=A0A9P0Q959_ACAOB|nr:unnamed protein product [Acanthoscelides obtectus]CAK1682281.1 hypothetical protein AOBTE_LOCUS33530 [Acanthoscelides obtectus]